MKVTTNEQLLLKHLQGTISPYERTILMRVIEESEDEEAQGNTENIKLSSQKILIWEEIWQRTNLEMPSFDDKNLSFEEIVNQINQKLGFENTKNNEIPKEKKITQNSNQNRAIPSATALSERQEFEEYEESEFKKRLKKRKSKNSWFAFSVVMILAISLGVGLQYLNNYIDNQPKDWKNKTLADSSKVHYTTDSRFVFPTEFRSDERAVQLVGLAELEVKKNLISFILDAGSFRIKTKEAIFNVSSQDSLFVFVKKGEVTVYTTSDTLANLKENQLLRYYPKLKKWDVKEMDIGK
ncbi:hypothetical protein Fleli_1016 [Bernardetia litoralis DSM 6794]|uniref:Uncharacterized protein n=1 Tax=Bernardetia litoralis (strain ATCC 23117 / DSM 6794 / NBRC 15988 / NCIMB 1366 / Fx l1 / Sio-4) TaxID=880071 RepID=I4AHM8_BERLS|nr:FecR domain-containing protein [Bernardetia litoralis]AFM03463.1 hypothetical protein Fleli_1016 [Bernardetia litoralis DSM 6794]